MSLGAYANLQLYKGRLYGKALTATCGFLKVFQSSMCKQQRSNPRGLHNSLLYHAGSCY